MNCRPMLGEVAWSHAARTVLVNGIDDGPIALPWKLLPTLVEAAGLSSPEYVRSHTTEALIELDVCEDSDLSRIAYRLTHSEGA